MWKADAGRNGPGRKASMGARFDIACPLRASEVLQPLRIRFVWTRRSQGGEMGGKRRETPIEGVFIRCSRTFVFQRYPQVHCERFRCQGANLSDYVFDRSRRQAV